jgi:nitronate monooxygenase
MRNEAQQMSDVQRMQVGAGQSAALAPAEPAGELVNQIWNQAQGLLR